MGENLTGLDFWGACRIAAGTERRVRFKDGLWRRVLCSADAVRLVIKIRGCVKYWMPDAVSREEKAWEVEPEKPEEVFVWGVRDKKGASRVMNKPTGGRRLDAQNEEIVPWSDIGGFGLVLPRNNLFSPGEPQKYRLMPVKEENND
jgi:hypothetical protein